MEWFRSTINLTNEKMVFSKVCDVSKMGRIKAGKGYIIYGQKGTPMMIAVFYTGRPPKEIVVEKLYRACANYYHSVFKKYSKCASKTAKYGVSDFVDIDYHCERKWKARAWKGKKDEQTEASRKDD